MSPLLRFLNWNRPLDGLPWVGPPDTSPRQKSGRGAVARYKASIVRSVTAVYDSLPSRGVRLLVALYLAFSCVPYAKDFHAVSHQMAVGMSNPQIMMKAQLRDGTAVMVDDY